jgi:hypothetical protein
MVLPFTVLGIKESFGRYLHSHGGPAAPAATGTILLAEHSSGIRGLQRTLSIFYGSAAGTNEDECFSLSSVQ